MTMPLISETVPTLVGMHVVSHATDTMFGGRRRGYGRVHGTVSRRSSPRPHLKKYRVSWRGPKGGAHSRVILAKSADVARSRISRDFGVAKSKLIVKNTGR